MTEVNQTPEAPVADPLKEANDTIDCLQEELSGAVDALQEATAQEERRSTDRRTETFIASDGTEFHPDTRCKGGVGWRVGNTIISETALREFLRG